MRSARKLITSNTLSVSNRWHDYRFVRIKQDEGEPIAINEWEERELRNGWRPLFFVGVVIFVKSVGL